MKQWLVLGLSLLGLSLLVLAVRSGGRVETRALPVPASSLSDSASGSSDGASGSPDGASGSPDGASGSSDSASAVSGESGELESVYPFRDVQPGRFCYDAVCWAAANGITDGITSCLFYPDRPCTAAQAVTFLWRAAGSPPPAFTEPPFPDVKPEDYYYDALSWVAGHGSVLTTAEGTFSPSQPITREQFINLFYLAFGDGVRLSGTPFPDVTPDVREAAAWAWGEGITRGTTEDTFSPFELCTRGQIIAFLYRYFA